MKKEKIIILDHETGEVYVSDYDSNIYESYEDFYEIINEMLNLNLRDSNCSCMITQDELNIKFI